MNPEIMLRRVVFPEPDWPIIPKMVPSGIEILTSSRTLAFLNDFDTPFNWISSTIGNEEEVVYKGFVRVPKLFFVSDDLAKK